MGTATAVIQQNQSSVHPPTTTSNSPAPKPPIAVPASAIAYIFEYPAASARPTPTATTAHATMRDEPRMGSATSFANSWNRSRLRNRGIRAEGVLSGRFVGTVLLSKDLGLFSTRGGEGRGVAVMMVWLGGEFIV